MPAEDARMTAHNDANEELRARFVGLVIESVDLGHARPEGDMEAWQADDVMRLNTNRGPIVIEAGLIFGPRCVLTINDDNLERES